MNTPTETTNIDSKNTEPTNIEPTKIASEKIETTKKDNKKHVLLGKRLSQIKATINADYHHIWDCCCDHGLLGMALLDNQDNQATVHFVDVVFDLIQSLNTKLETFYPQKDWQSHCVSAEELPIEKHEGRHLVIVSGVGGDLTLQIVEALYERFPNREIDFLLCPIRQQYKLRTQLKQKGFRVRAESLVKENKLFYEIIMVTANAADLDHLPPLSKIGDSIWSTHSAEQLTIAREYRELMLAHYRNMLAGNDSETQEIYRAYLDLNLS